MADLTAVKAGNGVAFLVSYGIVAEIIAKACSSPQTMEINANARADTLMKWVNIGVAESIAVVAIAAYIDKQHRTAIISGGALAIIVTYAQYAHAKSSGLANGGPTTEKY